MSELSSGAKELVRAAKAARMDARLSAADRQRILDGLRGRLGAGAIPDGSASSGGMWGMGSMLGKGLTVAVICGLGAAAFFGWRGSNEETQPPATVLAGPSSIDPAVPGGREPQAPASQPEVPAASVSSLPVAPEPRRESKVREGRGRDRLAEEVALLSRAEADLHRGQAAQALVSLDEHQRRFPDGALAVERRAARARALCALGRAGEAKSDLARLSRVAAGSPLEARAREACGAPIPLQRRAPLEKR